MRSFPLLLCVLVVCLVRPARADEGVRGTARALADEGFEHYEAGRYREAANLLKKADQLYHAPTLVLMLARAYGKLGRLLEARAAYQRILDEKLSAEAPEPFREAQRIATREIKVVQARIPSLTVTVRGASPEHAEIRLDGRVLPTSQLGQRMDIDPGKHELTANGKNIQRASHSINVLEGAAKGFELVLEGKTKAASSQGPEPDAAGPGPLPWIALGVGAVGVGVGSVTGLMAMSKASDIKDRCDGTRCPPEEEGNADSAKTLANISNVAFIVGGVGLVGGITLFLTAPSDSPSPTQGAVRARLGPGQVSLEAAF